MSDQDEKLGEIELLQRDAQQLIATVLAHIQKSSTSVSRVYMTREQYSLLRRYRACIGDLDQSGMDYLGDYSIFGKEIFLADSLGIEAS